MANRYANLVGSNKIKDEWQKINTGFDKVQQEMDAKPDKSIAQVNNVQMGTDDTLTIEGSTGITISTNPEQKKVIITATGTSTPGPHGSAHSEFGADPIPLATPTEGGLMSAADKAKLDGATYAATAGTLVQRDSSGRFKAAAPAASDDVARKAEVDAMLPKAGGTMTGTLNMGGNIISNAQDLRLQHGTRFGEDSGQRTRINAESDRFDVITEDGMNYIFTARYDGTLQFRGQNIWRMDQLRWNSGVLEYNDGGEWRPVGGVKSVQRGFVDTSSDSETIDVTIAPVNINKSYVVLPVMGGLSVSAYVLAELVNATTLRFIREGSGTGTMITPWQVIESY